MSVLDILVKHKLIKDGDISAILEQAKKTGDLQKTLTEYGVSEKDYLNSKGEYFGVPFRDMEGKDVTSDVLNYVPEESAHFYKMVPLGIVDNVLEIGVVEPENVETQNALTFISSRVSMPIKAYLISAASFEKIIDSYRSLTGEVTQALTELETELTPKGDNQFDGPGISKVKGGEMRIVEEAPVTKIVATIVHYATEGEASDIHIEPMEDKIRVRFRVDGALATSLVLPLSVHDALVARIKILANMRLDERRKPQDGRFAAKIEGRKIDFRVSTLPTYNGEKIVMRILDSSKGVKSLDQMGLTDENLKLIKDAIKRPYGIILISGPTGSGKTTTLYSMLKELDLETENVMSLEDPVEYNIPSMNQSQIKPEIGYTFANGLRTALRQDPDVIMVGEIRDKETAQLAIQAALTGHLVLATIHTNSAVGVIPRLMDMGVDPYLIAPTLILAIAQRLVSLIYGKGTPLPIEGSIKVLTDKIFADLPEFRKNQIQIPKEIYEANPSPECPKGVKGRTAVFEIMQMNKEVEQVILKNPTDIDIMKVVRRQGMLTIKEDAMIKAFKGLIPFSEVNKV
jgi:type IV pilus assembly protein PilB